MVVPLPRDAQLFFLSPSFFGRFSPPSLIWMRYGDLLPNWPPNPLRWPQARGAATTCRWSAAAFFGILHCFESQQLFQHFLCFWVDCLPFFLGLSYALTCFVFFPFVFSVLSISAIVLDGSPCSVVVFPLVFFSQLRPLPLLVSTF